MNLLITGGTGFVGKNLSSALKGKHLADVLTRKRGEKNCIAGDLLDVKSIKPALKGKDIVIHLAFSQNYKENIIMTKNLINESKKAGIKKIIFLSSMSSKRKHPDDYGKIKQKLEFMIKNSGLNYTILRPSIIYGKGSTSFDFIIKLINKIPLFTPIIGSGKCKISPVHIKDVVSSISKCIKNKKTDFKEYDLPGGEEIYFIELIDELKSEMEIRKKNIHIPIWLCNFISIIVPRLISRENIKNLIEDSLPEIKEAQKDFAYAPIKFKNGIKNGLL